MIINLRTLPFGHSSLKQDVAFSDEQAEAADFEGPVVCRAEVDRMQSQIVLQIAYDVSIRFECARCITAFSRHITGEFSALVEHRASKAQQSDDDEVDAVYTDEDDLVDIGQSVYDEVMTAISLMPLCSEECSGIMVEDGDHLEEQIDPRWEKLKELREKKDR